MTTMPVDLIDVIDAARLHGVAPNTLMRRVNAGEVPAPYATGDSPKFSLAEQLACLAEEAAAKQRRRDAVLDVVRRKLARRAVLTPKAA
jgi:hypothetical protein